jgi:hypothetical protein
MVSPGGIVGGYRLLERLLPVPPLSEVTSESLETLSAKYLRRDKLGNRLGTVAWIVMWALFSVLIIVFVNSLHQSLGDVKHILAPFMAEYICYGAMLSLLSFMVLSLQICRWLVGRKEFEIYIAYCGWRMPWHFDLNRAFKWFFVLFFLPFALVVVMRAATYTAFTDQAILDSPFGHLGYATKRPYTDIRGLYQIQKMHGRQQDLPDRYTLIVFRDGSMWESNHDSQGLKLEEERAAAKFVSERTGLPIVPIDFRENVPKS